MIRVLAVVVVSAGLLAGCYGSTEPATNIGEDSATLRGQGTANNGPASSYFEYSTKREPLPGQARPRTPTRSWPAGASGPISERVSDLLVASRYSFRLCGADRGATPVCAQTRTLTTPTPTGDYVKGSFSGPAAPPGPPTPSASTPAADPTARTQRDVKFTLAGQTRTDTVVCLRTSPIFARIGSSATTTAPSYTRSRRLPRNRSAGPPARFPTRPTATPALSNGYRIPRALS